jgi:hypothetical protein
VIIMSLFTIGEGFIVAMATRQGVPGELYELGDIEGARPTYMLWRLTLPLMAPTLLLLMFRDTIFSFQANFVPALIVTEGGPAPYATTYLPLFIYRNGFEYPLRLRGCGDADDVSRDGSHRLPAVPDREALAARVCRLALRADVPPKACDFRRREADICAIQRANAPANLTFQLGRHSACARAKPGSGYEATPEGLRPKADPCRSMWCEARWRGPESNRRHHGFQPCALPTELPRRGTVSVAVSVQGLSD